MNNDNELFKDPLIKVSIVTGEIINKKEVDSMPKLATTEQDNKPEERDDAQTSEDAVEVKASVDTFAETISELQDRKEKLQREIEQIEVKLSQVQQYKRVAQAIDELLGEQGRDLVHALYEKMAV